MWTAMCDRLLGALGPRDDPQFCELALTTVMADVEGRLSALDHAPRHLLFGVARVFGKVPAVHPDDHANLRLYWKRGRSETEWVAAGEHPRVKRKRGHYSATACIPSGTKRLAVAEVLVLWRPRAPWAPPTDTEIGRVTHLFMRAPDGSWQLKGSRWQH